MNASVIIEDAQRMIGWDLTQLETRQQQMTRQAFSLALQEVWESWWWEQLMLCAAMPGAAVYAAGTTYAADDFVYFPATQLFYQAMQATTGNAPATLTGGSYVTNYAYWAEAGAAPSAGDYVADKLYNVGDQVRSLTDGLVYQLVTAGLTVKQGGSGAMFLKLGIPENGRPVYNYGLRYDPHNESNTSDTLYWDGTQWVYINHFGVNFTSADDVATPDLATTWLGGGYWVGQTMTVHNAGPDEGGWHALIPFTPEIAPGGTVRAVGANDLRNSPNPGQVDFELTLDGLRLPGWASGVPWVWYRRATPILDGDAFSSTALYTAETNLAFA